MCSDFSLKNRGNIVPRIKYSIIGVAGQYHFTPHHAHNRELYTKLFSKYVFHFFYMLDFSQQDEYSRTSPI